MVTEVSIYFHRLPREVYRPLLKEINSKAVNRFVQEDLFDFPYYHATVRFNPINRRWFIDSIDFAFRRSEFSIDEHPVYVNGFVTINEIYQNAPHKKTNKEKR